MAAKEAPDGSADVEQVARFPPDLLYRAADLYYLQNATQAEVAQALGTSRPTVSRLLAEARATGIVRIDVREPTPADTDDLAVRLVQALGLDRAWVAPTVRGVAAGKLLAPAVGAALRSADLRRGDALLVSSGATLYEVSRQELPALPGIVLAPTVGGRHEPEDHYHTNEIARRMALAVQGTPALLHAPAMPGPALHAQLMRDESVLQVTRLWRSARAALLGIGGPPDTRTSLPSVLPKDPEQLGAAVADICSRPFDRAGRPVPFAGSERLVAMDLADLRRIPHTIGVALGASKVDAILVAVRAGYVNQLVTDVSTARLLLRRCGTGALSPPDTP